MLTGGCFRGAVQLFLLYSSLLCRQCVGAISPYPLLLVVSFDGFRYDFMNKTATPNFDRIVSEGVRAQWIQPRFVSITFPNHFSIATGLYEESHGIVANSFFDPVLNDTFEMDDTEAKWWDVGGLPLWVLNQMTAPDRYSGGMMWPGTSAWIHNQTAHHYMPYNESFHWKTRVDTVIQWMTDPSQPANCVYLYFEQPDATEHKYGPESAQVTEMIEEVDNITGYLIAKLHEANLYDKVNLIITSDHGMTDIPKENVLYMSDFVDLSLFRRFGYSPVWSILPNPGKDEAVYDAFVNASKVKPFHVFKKDDIPESFHYKNNRRVMPILVSVAEHYDLLPERDHPITGTTGNHGYNNSLMSMQTFFIARGPQFRQGGYESEPFENIDIFSLGCHILGIVPTVNNGSMEIVKTLLRNNTRKVDDFVLVALTIMLSACLVMALFSIVGLRSKAMKVQSIRRMGTSIERLCAENVTHSEESLAFEESERLLVPQGLSSNNV